jgi:YebC/PmpR family DNA-binding regulatory protein
MAGHSKWAQIKRKKAVTDARRGKLFTRLLKEITVAARIGGGDLGGNARLRAAVQEARNANVPNDNIDRAIKRGTGELEGVAYDEIVYEGYGPGGAAILIEAVTDNKNRTVAELRHLFSKHNGSLGESGCVAWMFDKRGYFAIAKKQISEEACMELALELGAEDVSIEEDAYELYTSPADYLGVREALEERELEVAAAELALLPQTYLDLEPHHLATNLQLLEALEDHDDVQNVWVNFDVDVSVAADQAS